MRSPAEEEWLRSGFREAGAEELTGPVDAERVWLAATGALSAEERREVIDQAASDPAVAEAWRLAHRLVREAREDGIELEEPTLRAEPWRRWAWAAAAAGLLVALGLASLRFFDRGAPAVYRGENATIVQALDPPPACGPADCRLAWREVPGALSYRVVILTEDLVPLLEVDDVESTELRVSGESRTRLLEERAVLWQVEARLADDGRARSRTFRLEIDAAR